MKLLRRFGVGVFWVSYVLLTSAVIAFTLYGFFEPGIR